MAAVEPVDAKGEVHHAHGGAGSHVALSSMPFLQHTPENLKKLSLLDKVCFKFVTFVVKKRKKAFYLVTGFYVALMLLGMATRSMELSPQYQYAWIIDGKRNTKSRDMRLEAVEEVDKLDNSEVKPRDQQFQLLGTWIEYAGDGSDFFTAERLQTICEIERNLYDQKEWLDVCELDETEQCKIPALSILGKFYGSPWLYEMVNRRAAPCDLLEEADVTASWDAMVQAANSSVMGYLENGIFMTHGTLETGRTAKTRSLVYVGMPLDGYESPSDEPEKQLQEYLKYYAAVEEDLFDLFGVASTIIKSAYLEPWERGTVEFRCFAWLFQRLEWLRMQAMDSVFMLFTIVFVAFWTVWKSKCSGYVQHGPV